MESSLVVAKFVFGPFDDRKLVLPCEGKPWPKFVIPDWQSLLIETIYLLAGRVDEITWAYIWDDSHTLGGVLRT